MVLINKALNEVTVKLVYYGPGLCGKTTNLEKIYGNPKLENKGKMISMATETDRTLFFDFMPMELGTIGGQKVRVQIYTVPGQVFYDATRKLVLRGADGVVFVADSQSTMRESNLDSLENLKTNLRLNRIDPEKIALVIQYNKRDLPNVDSVEDMTEYMKPGNAPTVEASAKTGVGVTATLRAAVARMLENLKSNVDTTLYDEPELGRPDMTARSGVTPMSAGTPKLSMKAGSATAPAPKPAPAPAPPSAPFAEPEPMSASASPFESFSPVEAEPSASPFDGAYAAVSAAVADEPEEVEVEVDPFGAAATVEPEVEVDAVADNPFASSTAIHDSGAEREEIESLLASARTIVAALEDALSKARDHERVLMERLAGL
jgi:signal recognition particle receptor subunit beta